jgi:hypothetical protein
MTFNLYDVLEIMGFLLRPLGALVFGLAMGWLTLRVLAGWQTTVAAFLGMLGTFALLGHWVDGGATLGAFGLGAGAGLLVWGVLPSRTGEESAARARKK